MKALLAIFAYRGYIWRNAVNDLRYRYAGSGMGVFWNVINPALQVAIFGVLFGVVLAPSNFRGGERWVYLCLGLLPWLGVSETLARTSQSLVKGGGLVRMAGVPLEVLVAESTLASALSSQLAIAILILATIVMGAGLQPGLLLLPVAVLLLHAAAFGLGLLLACFRVFFLDTSEVLRVWLQLWMWTMPIVYAESMVPSSLQPWLALNPPYAYIREIRALGLGVGGFDPIQWFIMLGWAIASAALGLLVLNRLRSEVLDVV